MREAGSRCCCAVHWRRVRRRQKFAMLSCRDERQRFAAASAAAPSGAIAPRQPSLYAACLFERPFAATFFLLLSRFHLLAAPPLLPAPALSFSSAPVPARARHCCQLRPPPSRSLRPLMEKVLIDDRVVPMSGRRRQRMSSRSRTMLGSP